MKANRSIIYKDKESISFFLGEGTTLEREFIYKLCKRPFMKELNNASSVTLRIFNNACYICTLVFQADYPLLDLKEYEKIAADNHDDDIWINYIVPATMVLVVNWLSSEECQHILDETGQQKDVKELCDEICVSIKEQCAEGEELFRTLAFHEQNIPSGFIENFRFQRRTLLETMPDHSVKGIDILDSMPYLFDIIKNHPTEFTDALITFAKDAPMIDLNEAEHIDKLRGLKEWIISNTNEEPIVVEQAFNGQTGLPCFTSRQMGILMAAVGRITEKENPPGKTTLGEIVEKIAGYKSTTAGTNMRGAIPKDDTEFVATAIESKFPNLAAEVRKLAI